ILHTLPIPVLLLTFIFLFFFFHLTPPTQIYTLSLHDALPILIHRAGLDRSDCMLDGRVACEHDERDLIPLFAKQLEELEATQSRSEEHTSELQSQSNLVCRLLLEKKKKKSNKKTTNKNVNKRT